MSLSASLSGSPIKTFTRLAELEWIQRALCLSFKKAHSDGCVEEVWEAEEGGGIADGDHQEGGEEGHHGLGFISISRT